MTAAGCAQAAISWTAGDIGVSQTIDFAGYSPVYMSGSAAVPGLTSQLTLTLKSIVGDDWVFGYDMTNTSTSPITASRVTVFGFDIAQPYAGVTSTGLFNSPHSGATQLEGSRNLCFSTISFGQCIGSYFGGVAKGGSASGLLDLKYTATQVQIALNNLFVAYQGVNSPTLCLCHQDAAATAVPEPSTWAMMITGVGVIGLLNRRRRSLRMAL